MSYETIGSDELAELNAEFDKTPSHRVINLKRHSPPQPGYVLTTSVGVRSYDITGMRFGYLVAIRPWAYRIRKDNGKPDGTYWVCRCDCGRFSIVLGNRMTKANGTISCGCAVNECSKDAVVNLVQASVGRYAMPKKLPASEIANRKHFTDMKGTRVGFLTAKSVAYFVKYVSASRVNKSGTQVRYEPYWNCTCVCGTGVVRDRGGLLKGIKKSIPMSCGCMRGQKRVGFK